VPPRTSRLEATAPPPWVTLTLSTVPTRSRAVLSRLGDYAADARVELEICAAEDEIARRGYAARLSVLTQGVPEPELEAEIEVFVSDTEGLPHRKQPHVKVAALEHYLLVVKHALHGLHEDDENGADVPQIGP
jgi:hypothetical protein